ncbi:hypothetical protein AALP_AA8G112800 [Arabis alpina]|uniref:Uncharacterized protein n=1 Tax=Arabis alpina TaxID=50452 RepID=A0A087G6B9_ARAAL|nr:hypothetical protein AALP_AA8G112800 [Arabis alpina]
MLSGTRPEATMEAMRLQQMDLHRRLSISASAVFPLSKAFVMKSTGVPPHHRLSGEIQKQREEVDRISIPLLVKHCNTNPMVLKIFAKGGPFPTRSLATVPTSPPQPLGELMSSMNHSPLSLAPAMLKPPDLLAWPDLLLVVTPASSPLAPPDPPDAEDPRLLYQFLIFSNFKIPLRLWLDPSRHRISKSDFSLRRWTVRLRS